MEMAMAMETATAMAMVLPTVWLGLLSTKGSTSVSVLKKEVCGDVGHIITALIRTLMPGCLTCSVQGIILAGGPSDNALARFRAMPAVKLGQQL